MKKAKALLCLSVVGFMVFSLTPVSVSPAIHPAILEQRTAPLVSTAGAFALSSTFTSGGTYGSYGWTLLSGSAKLTSRPNYFGETSMEVTSGSTLANSKGVISGDQLVSFQVAIYAGKAMAMFGIEDSSGSQAAAVGVMGTTIYAGQGFNSLEPVSAPIPSSVYPSGWVYLTANVLNTSSAKSFSWTMQLFVDGSSSYFANISTPAAFSYSGIEVAVAGGAHAASYFTDIVFTTYQIPINIPGYNPMEG